MTESIALPRYRAFISYSHTDEAIVRRLHRRLERYRPPRGLKTNDTDGKARPGRIQPVFRDRDELAGASRLSEAIEAALQQSAALIVVCSPAAVASHWVGEEVRGFRLRHPDRPVLAFVVAGDPAADPRERPTDAAFPLPLVLSDPADNDSELLEPLAADARVQGDGFSAAFLKLVAGLLDVGFDELRQRDLRHRQRLWSLAIAVSLALSACFAFLAWQATRARDTAREAQARAELELTSERQTRNFLLSVFELADAGKSRGNQVTVREVLDRAVARIDNTPFDRPAIKSRYLATMGQAYASLGIYRRAKELLFQSLAALPSSSSSWETRAQQVDTNLELANLHFLSGDYGAALSALDPITSSESQSKLTDSQRARAEIIRGNALLFEERDDEAEKAFQHALHIADTTRLSREDTAMTRGSALNGLAILSQFAGNHGQADIYFGDALRQLAPAFGESHPDSLATIGSRASNAYFAGDMETARREWQHSLTIAERLYDPLSPEVGTLKNNLGRLALETDDLTSAESMLNDAIASDRKFRTEGFDDLAYPLNSLAMVKLAQGDAVTARKLLDEALSIAEAANHPILGPVLTHVADLDCQANPSPEALAMAQHGLDTSAAREDASEWRLAEARLTLAFCRRQLGHQDSDRKQAHADVATIRKHFSADNVFTRRAEAQLETITSSR